MTSGSGNLVVQTNGDVTSVFFRESRILDETTVQAVAKELFDLVDNSFKIKLLLDFENVDYLSSAVLGKLVALFKKVKEAKGDLKLCGIKPSILQVFQITKLDKLFEIFPDQVRAMQAFKKKSWLGR